MLKNKEDSLFKKLTRSREASLFVVLVLLCAFIQLRNSDFLTVKTLTDMLKNYSFTMVLALGMMLVLLVGGIDIAIGSTLALSGMSASLLMSGGYYSSTLVAFLVSIAVGAVCGLLNGSIITKGKLLPIIATLGTMYIFRGLTYLVSGSRWVSAYQFASNIKDFGQGRELSFGLLNNATTIALICYIIFFLLMKWTKFGRRFYAVGSNLSAAGVSGIKTDRIKLMAYTLMGAFSGLAGAMYVSLYASAQGDMGKNYEMDAIAACVLGGVSLSGGQGSVFGVLLGSIAIAIIGKALPMIGVSQFWQMAIKGAIIIFAIVVNVITQRVMNRSALERREI
jgi:rhamnose transport system permease protein